jgi:hypothetical protein
MSQKFKYLGVELHGTAGIKACIPHRLSCMMAAQSAISRRLHELRVPKDPSTLLADMFDSVITGAAGSYGCEVWSTGTYQIVLCNVTKQLCISKH